MNDSCRVAIKSRMVAEPVCSSDGTQRNSGFKAAQERRAERSILYCKEESYQVSGGELRARSEVNALSHGYSRTDRRSNERNAEADCRTGKPIGGRTPPQRKPRQSSTGVGQVDDATSTTASSEIGGHKGNWTPVKLRQ